MDTFNEALVRFFVELLLAALTIGLPILGAKLHGMLAAAAASYRANTTAQQRATIDAFIRLAVQAAEQTGLADAAKNTGQAKKQAALAEAHALLLQHGINLDLNELDSRIEAMVMEQFNRERNTAPLIQFAEPVTSPTPTIPLPDASPAAPALAH